MNWKNLIRELSIGPGWIGTRYRASGDKRRLAPTDTETIRWNRYRRDLSPLRFT